MIAALPALTLPLLQSPATVVSAPEMPLDEAFALLIARAAPVERIALPVLTDGQDVTLPTVVSPPANDAARAPEPMIDPGPPPLPLTLHPVLFVQHDAGMAEARAGTQAQAPAWSRNLPAQVGRPAAVDDDGPDRSTPRADAAVTAFLLPVVAVALSQASALTSTSTSTPAAPLAPAETSALDRHMQFAPGNAALDAITQDIVASAAQTGRARFVVTAEMLGRVDVDVALATSGITVHFATSSRAATDALVTAQPLLAESVGTHGIRLADVQVSTGGSGADRQPGSQRPPGPVPLPIETAPPHATSPTPSRTRNAGRFA